MYVCCFYPLRSSLALSYSNIFRNSTSSAGEPHLQDTLTSVCLYSALAHQMASVS